MTQNDTRAISEAQNAERIAAMQGEIENLRRATVDAIAPTAGLRAEVVEGDNLPASDRIRILARTADGSEVPLRVLDSAHEQIATKLDIPRKFYDRLLTAHPDLLVHTMSALFTRESEPRMLRMLRPSVSDAMMEGAARTGTQFAMRAMLSNKFRPLDTGGLMDQLIPAAAAHNLRLAEYNLDERKFIARFVGPERSIGEIREAHGFKATGDNYHARDENGKDRAWVNEVLSFGVAVTNSETGHGALAVREMTKVLRCLNDYVKNEVSRTRHVGKRQDETDDFEIAGDTQRLELAAVFARVRDRFIAAVNETAQKTKAETFAKAMGTTLELPEALPMMEFINVVGERFKLSERESELLQEEVTHELIETGRTKPSAFSVAQGFTAMAKRLGEGQQDRRQEIESIGWQIVADPTTHLIKAAQDAVKARKS